MNNLGFIAAFCIICSAATTFVSSRRGLLSKELCPPGKVWSLCSERCHKTCKYVYEKGWICSSVCKDDCECEDGFLETNNGECVPGDSCPENVSGHKWYAECQRRDPNLVYKVCHHCNRTCFDPEPQCGFHCFRPSCVCKGGYVEGPNGNCIEPTNCPIE